MAPQTTIATPMRKSPTLAETPSWRQYRVCGRCGRADGCGRADTVDASMTVSYSVWPWRPCTGRTSTRELAQMQWHEPLAFAKGCPVMRIPSAGMGRFAEAFQTQLFDLATDPGQVSIHVVKRRFRRGSPHVRCAALAVLAWRWSRQVVSVTRVGSMLVLRERRLASADEASTLNRVRARRSASTTGPA